MKTLDQLGISPAPWRASGGHWVEFGDYKEGDEYGMFQTFAIPDTTEATSNARLIAAAPKLYEALRGLLEWRHGVYIDDPARTAKEKVKAMSEFCGLIANARAALAAAGGESEKANKEGETK